MTEIKWEEPPTDGRTKADVGAIARALRERPGEWAKVHEGITSATAAQRIKRGHGSWSPEGAFEAVSRKSGDRIDVYARYVGEAKSA